MLHQFSLKGILPSNKAMISSGAKKLRSETVAVAIAVLVGAVVSCKGKLVETLADKQPKASVTEIFHLRTECAGLSDTLYKAKEDELEPTTHVPNYAWWHTVEQVSHYDAETNRCYVELTVHTTSRNTDQNESWNRELYDGQTKEMLASTTSYTYKDKDNTGMVYVTADGFNAGFEGASRYIDDAMKDDRRQP